VRGPVVLVILDGFGIGDGSPGDAIAAAETPFFDSLNREYPRAALATSGAAVGLPDGQMGNSEVGHMTLGAGRIFFHDLVRVQRALDQGEFEQLPAFRQLVATAERADGQLHLLGLVSDGGVHSSLTHLEGVIDLLARVGIRPILHAFTDGRDTPPRSALDWFPALEARLAACGGRIASLSGRYYAMDRDRRWERVAEAYKAIVDAEGLQARNAIEAIEKAYARGESDEFIRPTVIGEAARIEDGSAALFLNFRADRARELTNALTRVLPDQLGPEITPLRRVQLERFVTLTEYDRNFGLPSLFPPIDVRESLGELVSRAHMRQLRIAETEKYAHVTYFFNGGVEAQFEGEDRILIPSPRDVETYDQKPEMSAEQVTQKLLEALRADIYQFVLVNYANPDMVGHTGVLPASIEAVRTVDDCLRRVSQVVLERGGELLITADHGNIERMIDPATGGPHTAHTTGPVPIWWVRSNDSAATLRDGGLADVAPTLCERLGLEVSSEMSGRSLIACGNTSSIC